MYNPTGIPSASKGIVGNFTVRHWNKLSFQIERVLRAGLRRFIGLSWVSANLYEYWLEFNSIPHLEAKVPVKILIGNQGDIERVRSFFEPEKIQIFENRFQQNMIWLLALVEDQVSYSSWISFEDDFETTTQVWVSLAAHEAYVLDCITFPRFRGLKLHTFMTTQHMQIAKENGATWLLTMVLTNNLPARFVVEGCGMQVRENILKIRFLGRNYYRRAQVNNYRGKNGLPTSP
jgi:hypothetical protein